MFCTSCGTRNGTDSNFCKQCGVRLEKISPIKLDPDKFERALPDEEQLSALLERAYQRRKEGDLEGAISLCREALELPTETTSAHSLLGQLYEEQGDREAAIHEYEQVLVLNPGSIADRVKLDQLRNQDAPLSAQPARVHLSHEPSRSLFDLSKIVAVSVPIVLVLLGGVITLLWIQRSNNNSPISNNSTRPTTGDRPDKQIVQADTKPEQSNRATPPLNTNQHTTSTITTPLARNQAQPPYTGPQAIYVQMPAPKDNRDNRDSGASGRVAEVRPRSNSGRPTDVRDRVRLTDTDSGDGNLTIKVDGRGDGQDTQGNNDPNREPNREQRLEVVKPGPGNPATASPTGDSRSLIALGQEKKLQKEYRPAIDAFTKALPNAGDQVGFVLQQRATCYQKLGDFSSAHSDYSRAIEEYHKIEGTDPETARNGIRVCERGIQALGTDASGKSAPPAGGNR